MASYDQHLAYLAEHDPARALQEYRRRKAATPQQKAHAPLTLSQQGRQSDIPASAEASMKATVHMSAYTTGCTPPDEGHLLGCAGRPEGNGKLEYSCC